jgi:hypothetical protein
MAWPVDRPARQTAIVNDPIVPPEAMLIVSSSHLSSWAENFSPNRPPLTIPKMMIGSGVAPLAPRAQSFFTKAGSIESSQNLVPLAICDCYGTIEFSCGRLLERALPGLTELKRARFDSSALNFSRPDHSRVLHQDVGFVLSRSDRIEVVNEHARTVGGLYC